MSVYCMLVQRCIKVCCRYMMGLQGSKVMLLDDRAVFYGFFNRQKIYVWRMITGSEFL